MQECEAVRDPIVESTALRLCCYAKPEVIEEAEIDEGRELGWKRNRGMEKPYTVFSVSLYMDQDAVETGGEEITRSEDEEASASDREETGDSGSDVEMS
jgi:hypothetical protein